MVVARAGLAKSRLSKGQKIKRDRLKKSSKEWVRRQLDDPYVAKAQAAGWRARAAFKLLEIDEKFTVLHGRRRMLDLGCAPGSWCQIAAAQGMHVVGIDLLACDPLAGVTFLQGDFSHAAGLAAVMRAMEGHKPDVIVCDMAANTVGHKETDGLRTQSLTELAVDFVPQHLALGGHFVTKIFMNGYENEAKRILAPLFTRCQLFKPPSSRAESREIFLVALGFKGPKGGR